MKLLVQTWNRFPWTESINLFRKNFPITMSWVMCMNNPLKVELLSVFFIYYNFKNNIFKINKNYSATAYQIKPLLTKIFHDASRHKMLTSHLTSVNFYFWFYSTYPNFYFSSKIITLTKNYRNLIEETIRNNTEHTTTKNAHVWT